MVLCFLVALPLVALPVPAQVLVVALRGVAEVAFFPQLRGFELVLGISIRVWEFFEPALEFLGCASSVAL